MIHKVHVHPPTPTDKEKEKENSKEEDGEDDLTLLITLANLDIGRVMDVGSLGVGKYEYDNDYT